MLHAEDPGFLPAKAQLMALQVGNMTTATTGSLARLPEEHSSRRLEEGLKLCDGFVNFTMHVIITAEYGWSAVAADLDGDGDLDVLSSFANSIAWFENLEGAADLFSGPQRVITNRTGESLSVVAADLDGDGDLDILAALTGDKEIVWYQNLDGAGNFSGAQRVSKGYPYDVQSVAAADFDGDGNNDVLYGSCCDLAWYDNWGGAGYFPGQERCIERTSNRVKSVAAVDLDGDADLDVLSVNVDYTMPNDIRWYENLDGAGKFSGHHFIEVDLQDLESAVAADLDGDGDLDVLFAYQDTAAWCENLDGDAKSWGPARIITTWTSGLVAAADLDGDGDLDILMSTGVVSALFWFENLDGAGDFSGTMRFIGGADDVLSVAAADLDGDADLDVLSATFHDGKIAWYENECMPRTPKRKPTTTPKKQLICVAWCAIFGITSIIVLGYVMHASQRKDKNLARIILTIVLSQCDYASDTLFIGFQKFVTPTLLVAAISAYFLPLAVFIVVYRRVVGMHLVHIYKWTTKTFVHHEKWDDFAKVLIGIRSFVLFPFALLVLYLVYMILLFIFISCKLMSVSYYAAKFFEMGGFDCTQEAFEVMFKRNILSELVFESTGELMIVLVDYSFRDQQEFPSITGVSTWALLSIIGSSLMLVFEAWPYLYHIVWMGRGLDAGIAAVSIKLEFMPEDVLAASLMGGSFAYRDLSYPQNLEIHGPDCIESAEERKV